MKEEFFERLKKDFTALQKRDEKRLKKCPECARLIITPLPQSFLNPLMSDEADED